MFRENEVKPTSGFVALLVLLALDAALAWLFSQVVLTNDPTRIVPVLILGAILAVAHAGFFVVNPGDARVLVLFGSY